jgi:hypothetical protein
MQKMWPRCQFLKSLCPANQNPATRTGNPMANANTEQITCTAAMLSMIKLIGFALRRDQNVDAEISPLGHV